MSGQTNGSCVWTAASHSNLDSQFCAVGIPMVSGSRRAVRWHVIHDIDTIQHQLSRYSRGYTLTSGFVSRHLNVLVLWGLSFWVGSSPFYGVGPVIPMSF